MKHRNLRGGVVWRLRVCPLLSMTPHQWPDPSGPHKIWMKNDSNNNTWLRLSSLKSQGRSILNLKPVWTGKQGNPVSKKSPLNLKCPWNASNCLASTPVSVTYNYYDLKIYTLDFQGSTWKVLAMWIWAVEFHPRTHIKMDGEKWLPKTATRHSGPHATLLPPLYACTHMPSNVK